jgi:hypothetical protein
VCRGWLGQSPTKSNSVCTTVGVQCEACTTSIHTVWSKGHALMWSDSDLWVACSVSLITVSPEKWPHSWKLPLFEFRRAFAPLGLYTRS